MEASTMDVITSFISQVGFPIFVAVWMLTKASKDNQKTNDALDALRQVITELTTTMKK